MKQLEEVGTGYRYTLDKIVRGICYYTRTVAVPVSAFGKLRKPPKSISVAIAKQVKPKPRKHPVKWQTPNNSPLLGDD